MSLERNVLKFIWVLLVSCDPAKTLIIQNKTSQEIRVFIPKKYQRTIARWDTTSIFILKPIAHEKRYYHGLGGWSKEEEENIRKTFSEHCLLFVQDSIFYKTNIISERKGLSKSNLIITIQ
ncbi:MAG: hypothetical protein MUC49_18125 [Raineya sp.]|jgi:hypothetical protein|nr:hypothetical protein [Raineya sp.]